MTSLQLNPTLKIANMTSVWSFDCSSPGNALLTKASCALVFQLCAPIPYVTWICLFQVPLLLAVFFWKKSNKSKDWERIKYRKHWIVRKYSVSCWWLNQTYEVFFCQKKYFTNECFSFKPEQKGNPSTEVSTSSCSVCWWASRTVTSRESRQVFRIEVICVQITDFKFLKQK